jgi:hypothetical protein
MADPVIELAASQAVLRELCGADSLCYVMPGVGTVTNDLYLKTLDGGTVYIGARSTSRKVNYVNSYNPFRVSAYAVTRHSTKQLEDGSYTTNENSSRELCLAAGVETWKSHIDSAVEGNAWAAFCFHGLVPAGTDTNGKWTVYEEQVDAIFKYADRLSKSGDAWVANFTEASIYYREWKEASLKTTVFADESLKIVLETALDPSIFNMPLTVKVAVPKSWTSASCDGKELEIIQNEDGTQFVYINIAPGESAVITK